MDGAALDAEYSAGRPHPALRGLVLRYAGYREFSATPLRRRQATAGRRPGRPARWARVDAALLGLLDASRVRPDPEVAWAWRQLRRSGGRAAVAEPAAGRVLRFQRATGPLVPAAPSISEVAATCGYADHPHPVREFRALAGVTPSA